MTKRWLFAWTVHVAVAAQSACTTRSTTEEDFPTHGDDDDDASHSVTTRTDDDHTSTSSDESETESNATSTDDPGDHQTIELPKLDLEIPDLPPQVECDEATGIGCTCTAVDILFVIDNSVSMDVHQESLAQAFPEFVDAMASVLDVGVNVRIGVTSTEMGYSPLGMTDGCKGIGGDSMYITPDSENTGRPASQGRMVRVDGQAFTTFTVGDDAVALDEASSWFVQAASLGTTGSNVEMSSAAAGWAFDAVNLDENDHFVRDAGAVLVVFFVQDEPDQTPANISGADLFAKLATAKSECGGAKCIIGGGMLARDCLPSTPLGEFLDAMGKPPVVEQIPQLQGADPQLYIDILKNTLAGVIEETCDEILPPK